VKNSELYRDDTPKLLLRPKFSRQPSPFVEGPFVLNKKEKRVYGEVRGKYARPDRTLNPYYLPDIINRVSSVAPSRRSQSLVNRSDNQSVAQGFQENFIEDSDSLVQLTKKEIRQEKLVIFS
jgi:hypothetical protein